jgi:hypothetical protein
MPLTELEIESIAKALIKAEEERNPIDPITDRTPLYYYRGCVQDSEKSS